MRFSERFAELFEDWRYMFHTSGPAALPTIAQELTYMPFRHLRFLLMERSLVDPFPYLPPKISLYIRQFEPGDVAMVRKIDRPSEARLCARRLECGHTGLMALFHGEPAGYAWGCADINPRVERVPLKLMPGDVLCTDVYTNPAYRGKGVQTALSLARFQLFRDLGFQKAVCYIEVHNAPSLAVWQRKLGAIVTGTIDFLRIGSWYRVRVEPVVQGQPGGLEIGGEV